MADITDSDSSIPRLLRVTIRRRRNAAFALEAAIRQHGLCPRAYELIDRVAEINRSLRSREWLPRVAEFDPILLGM